MSFDLHAHTTASDGTFTPSELVVQANNAGLNGVAVTDHDTIDGVKEATEHGKKMGITVIPGVELGAVWKSREVHVLGYFIDTDSSLLTELFDRMKRGRVERMNRMVENLQKSGVQVSYEDVLQEAGGAVIGRPHLARVLVAKGYASSLQDAFLLFLSKGKPGYAERPKLSPQEAVQTILAANGVPVIAHPGLVGDDQIITELVEAGLQGIEALHPDHSDSERQHYLEMARSLGIVATGGSDFHGKGAEHRGDLGTVRVDGEIVEQLKKRIPNGGKA